MDVLGITSGLIALADGFRKAYLPMRVDSQVHRLLLRQFSLHMRVLVYCVSVINNTREGPLLDAILEVAKQCEEIGARLSERDRVSQMNFKKRITFVLASWETLEALYKDFTTSVSLLHNLVQSSIMQEMRHDLMELPTLSKLAMHNELDSLERFDHNEYSMDQNSRSERNWEYQSIRTPHPGVTSNGRARFPDHPTGQRVRQDWESTATGASFFTIGAQSAAEVMTLAEEVVAKSVARGVHFDPDPSLVLGTVAIVHEVKPRFVPVRVKYDTGSDANFVPLALVEKNGLSKFLEKLETDSSEDNVFVGLNDQEYVIQYTIEIQWSAATMRNVRTTHFHVADDLPYDMILGNSFVQENQVFHPQRVALPLHHKHRPPAEKKKDQERKEAHQLAAGEEERRTRTEDARKRALARAAIKLAKEQTSAQASADRLRANNNSSISLMGRTPTPTPTPTSRDAAVRPSFGSSTSTLGQTTTGTVTPTAEPSIFTRHSSDATSATSQSTTPMTSIDGATPTRPFELRTKGTDQVDNAREEEVAMDAAHG